MEKWTNKFKKRRTEKKEEQISMPPVQEALQNQANDDYTIKYVAQTKTYRNPEDAKGEKQIVGLFSKRRLSYVWGWVAFCCIYAILLSAVPYWNEQDSIRRESAPRYEFDFTNLTEILTKEVTPKRFNPYIILIVVSSLLFISSLTVWLSVQMKDVKVILQRKNGKVYFSAKGSFFSAKYNEVKDMCAYQLLCRTKYSIFHFLILGLATESGVYTLGQSVAESKNYGLEMKKGGFYGIQLLSAESDTVFNMAKFLGLADK